MADIMDVNDVVEANIDKEDNTPVARLQCLRFVRELMKTHNEDARQVVE